MKSIRRSLLIALISSFVLAMAVGGYATYVQARAEANEMFDYHLRQLALSLRDQTFRSALLPELRPGEEAFDFVIQVWDDEGVRLYLSHPHSALPDQARLGFATIQSREGAWRVFAVQQRGQTIQVSQPLSVRDKLAATAALRTLLPFLILMPAFTLLMWIIVGRGLHPLARVTHAVSSRSASSLAPIPEQPVPEEVQPLVHALNDLLLRLQQAFAGQRAFIADAAHELRTPLTALKLQVQLTERARTEQERAEALADLHIGLQRASHVVQQLLTLARQEPGAQVKPFAVVRLDELARQVVADMLALAESRYIDLGVVQCDANAGIEGDADALRTLLSNLVDNAVRYTPEHGKVDVDVVAGNGNVCLQVSDSGPGIPAEERSRVFDRFYRSANATLPGSGLGLAIVRTVADRHDARVELTDAPQGGLRARVVFPALTGSAQ